jgi:hypothetical protein
MTQQRRHSGLRWGKVQRQASGGQLTNSLCMHVYIKHELVCMAANTIL